MLRVSNADAEFGPMFEPIDSETEKIRFHLEKLSGQFWNYTVNVPLVMDNGTDDSKKDSNERTGNVYQYLIIISKYKYYLNDRIVKSTPQSNAWPNTL